MSSETIVCPHCGMHIRYKIRGYVSAETVSQVNRPEYAALSTRALAKQLGVSHVTVHYARRQAALERDALLR
jgi:DNA-binding transcriptional regulator YhcF (GntR family)